jgi:hypothetical protein
MQIIVKNIEFNIFSKEFLTNDIVDLLKKENQIYLIPQTLYQYILSKMDKDKTLNNSKYWVSCLELYTSILQGINSSSYLKEINYEYNIILNEWRSNNILNKGRGRYTDKDTFTYTFKETSSYCFIVLVNDEPIKNNIDVELDDYYKETLLNCDIEIDKAIYDEYLNRISINNFVKRVSRMFYFFNKRYIKKGKYTNRWYNSFSSLTSISRKYVKLNNKYFYEIDLSNAQPTLLAVYLSKIYGNDFDINFINDTSKGLFYNKIMDKAKELNIEVEKTYDKENGYKTIKSFSNRDDVKKLCYQNIFFGRNEKSLTFSIFTKLYPNTWRLLNYELNGGTETLALILQNMEADIFLNIKPKCNYFTVHDAIYINDISYFPYVKEKIRELMGTDNFNIKADFDKQDKSRINYNITTDIIDDTFLIIIDDVNRKPHKEHKNSTKDKVIDLVNKGYSKQEIVKELNISSRTYYRHIKE